MRWYRPCVNEFFAFMRSLFYLKKRLNYRKLHSKGYVGALLMLVSLGLYALEDFDRQQIQQRIQPVGSVRIQEHDRGLDVKTTQATEEQKAPGQARYEQYCIICHRDGLAGAPKFRDVSDWKSRTEGKTLDDLLAAALKGLNAMPPKGTCAECSDADLKAIIQYMLPQS